MGNISRGSPIALAVGCFTLFDMKENKPLASGLAEKIGEEIGQLKIKSHLHHNDQELKEKLVIKNHASGLLTLSVCI